MRAVGVVGWLSASGALAQQASPSEPATSDALKPSAAEQGVRAQFGVQLSYAVRSDNESHGPGARLQLLARFNDYIAAGPETAIYFGASAEEVYRGPNPDGGEYLSNERGGLLMLSGVLRLGLDRGPFRPALVMGAGVGVGRADSGFYPFLGAELAVAPGRFPVVFDARYYKSMFDSDLVAPDYLTVGLGTRF